MRHLAWLLLRIALAAPVAASERAESPGDATVFIKVVGKLHAEVDAAWKEELERHEVEIGTGSGFVVSEYGHVLTNHHVIQGAEFHREIQGKEVTIRLEVERLEVVAPPRRGSGELEPLPQRFLASIDAQDPGLDLAVLSVSGAELPYIPFGDSDATASGQPVEVLGFPYGREVELGLARLPDIVPRVSVHRGAVSALRLDEDGRTRYVQTSALLNPGNSGGPMVDAEGYAVGVVRARLAEAPGIGFAVPINRVKDFLEERGLLPLLPSSRLRRGGRVSFEEKGVSLEMPEGLEDGAPVRTRIDSRRLGSDARREIHLAVDRVASDWPLDRLKQALVAGLFGDFKAAFEAEPRSSPRASTSLVGQATGHGPRSDEPLKMEYALVALGREKLLARYLGPADAVAFNLSVLRDSLASIDARPLLLAEIARPLKLGLRDWVETALPHPGSPHILLPVSWVQEAAAPFPCAGLAVPDSALTASPAGDFTVSFRAAWWKDSPEGEARPPSACSPERGRLGARSYAYETRFLGMAYHVEGVFVTLGESELQLEAVAPKDKFPFLEETFEAWARHNGAP